MHEVKMEKFNWSNTSQKDSYGSKNLGYTGHKAVLFDFLYSDFLPNFNGHFAAS
jgi:hypothetical protein